MAERRKIKAVSEIAGAIVLTLLMQLMGVFGYGQYTWMCFLPLLMFFAFGANFKKIPEMLLCYAIGELWCVVNSLVMGAFTAAFGPGNMVMSNIVPTIIVIFCILLVHENLFEGRIFSNVPCIFMGMATSFFVLFMRQPIGYVHLFCFWAYGIVLACCLILGGMAICSAIFGKERAAKALMPLPPRDADK